MSLGHPNYIVITVDQLHQLCYRIVIVKNSTIGFCMYIDCFVLMQIQFIFYLPIRSIIKRAREQYMTHIAIFSCFFYKRSIYLKIT